MVRGWCLEGMEHNNAIPICQDNDKGYYRYNCMAAYCKLPSAFDGGCLGPPPQTVVTRLVCIQQIIKAGENVPGNLSHGHHMARTRVLGDNSPHQFGDNVHVHVSTGNCSADRPFVLNRVSRQVQARLNLSCLTT